MPPRTRLAEVTSQRDALEQIAKLIRSGSVNGKVLQAAKAITMDCDARDDLCEVESVYEAVKTGDSRVPGLARGMRYVSDPRSFDTFYSAAAMLDQCEQGSCAGDCDDSTILIGSLLASLGYMVGARAWGPGRSQSDDYQHVYCVVAIPKSGPWPKDYFGHGLDVTVAKSFVGWEPPGGHVMTAWID